MGIQQTIVQPKPGASLHEMMLDLHLQSFLAWPLRYRSVLVLIGGNAFADGLFPCRWRTRFWVSALYRRTGDECDSYSKKRDGKKTVPFEPRSYRLCGSLLFQSFAGDARDIARNGVLL
jgi:hypothetical protein